MRYLSVCSGVGGLDLGFAAHELVMLCERNRRCRGVLARHWPGVHCHGDLATLGCVGGIDLVVGGTPCQDLSAAGLRRGLAGERSGLYWDFCRVADEAEAAWVVWENVPGALASNDGADFAAVLWGLTGALPRVPDGGWRTMGYCAGPKRDAAWRVLDAQWFGLAQRRKRLFVVGGPRSGCPDEVLDLDGASRGDAAPLRQTDLGRREAGGRPHGYVRSHRPVSVSDAEVWRPAHIAPALTVFEARHMDRPHILAVTPGRVRLLTPVEHERLMGWPADHTRWSFDDEVADSTRYIMCANGVAAPVGRWIASRLPGAGSGTTG